VHIVSPGKFICVLVPFLVLLGNLMCSRNLFKKVAPGKGCFCLSTKTIRKKLTFSETTQGINLIQEF